MRIQSFTVISAYDNLALACVAYEPESSPKGVFQIVHGMCERKERYDKFMRFLAEHGFVAVAMIIAGMAPASSPTPISAGSATGKPLRSSRTRYR